MAGNTPQVSVVIRNRNEATHLSQVLRALSVQSSVAWELIVVDNESTDDSIEIARGYGAKLVSLAEDAFTYGHALNEGLALATADVCVILSAHSLPLGRQFLQGCLAPFEDPLIAAARCVYVGKGSDAIRWTVPEILNASSSIEDIISKGPLASGCVIRRSVWTAIRFDETAIAAEDKLWAIRVLRAGYSIASPCDAFYLYLKVLSPSELLRKNDLELRAVFSVTGKRFDNATARPPSTLMRALWAIATEAPRAVASVVHREVTRLRLRRAFPDRAEQFDAAAASEERQVLKPWESRGDREKAIPESPLK